MQDDDYKFDLHVRTDENALVDSGIMGLAFGLLQSQAEFDEIIDQATFLANDPVAKAERCFDNLPAPPTEDPVRTCRCSCSALLASKVLRKAMLKMQRLRPRINAQLQTLSPAAGPRLL